MGKSIKVLIVEDSEDDAAMLIRALQRGGYDPSYEIVETPEAMADALNRQEWDLVISDYSMPCFSGLDALKLLQEKDPDLSFILISGQIGEDLAVEAMKAGAHDFILKGNPARLIPAVERELRDTQARRKNRQNEQALQESRERYRLIVEAAKAGIWQVDEESRTTFVNQEMAKMLGCTIDEMMGQTLYSFMDEEWSKLAEANIQRRSQGFRGQVEYKYQRKDGTDLWAIVSSSPFFRDDGSYAGAIGMHVDITERKRSEDELALGALLLDSANDSIVLQDFEGRFHYVNEVACRFYGYTREEMMQKTVFELNTPESAESWQLRINELKTKGRFMFELINPRKDGSRFPIEVKDRVVDIGGKQLVLSVARDITERKRVEERLKYLSFHDSMTGIYNRSYFDEEVRRLDVERQLPISIIMGDLNGLKLVNDTFGHQAGDSLLATAAAILQGSCRSEDILCRWGGDEFAIFLPKTGRKTAKKICDRIRSACEKASVGPVLLSFALGTATKENKEQGIELVLKEAEDIMYRDKLLDSRSTRFSTVTYFQRSLAERSAETLEHGKRIQDIVARIGDRLGLSGRKKEELDILAALHDIGQIAIPVDILVKPCYLTESEWELIRRHPEIGERIALSVPDLNNVAETILSHHEHWNGMGYPQGLKGEQIPLLSRILAIADAYDTMTNGRPYKKAISHREAVKEIEKCAGTQFDPQLVALFVEIFTS